MQSEGNKEQESKGKIPDQKTKALFSQKEIRTIVKDFAAAYISGQIKIHFLDAQQQLQFANLRGEKLSYVEAEKKELDMKNTLKTNIAISVGAKRSTPEEFQKAIDDLFDDILAYRNGGRIEGVFMEYAMEVRIRQLEEGMEAVNNLVEEIVEWVYRGATEQ